MGKNVFGQSLWLKKKVFQIVGNMARKRFLEPNNVTIHGGEVIPHLPEKGVLFISNHQTIFTDVITMYHVFFASLNGQINSIEKNNYLKDPKLNLYYVAARETMEKGILPKVLALAGAVSVDRTWRKGEEMIKREVNPDDTKSIGMAIKDGWVVTFPQGTTRQGAPVRKGTAHIIKQYKPVVVPVRVDGFREAFDKTGLKRLKTGVDLQVSFSEPLKIDYDNESVEELVQKMGKAIGEEN
ncbi:lysophospholipid acyltransferase family protein [Ekhidna sp.]|uniref:lysophospholipid acyltransferase family protein n=1 Tax=Ekhidna sp. TaxID=2608089 RepID=UPI003CCBF5FF